MSTPAPDPTDGPSEATLALLAALREIGSAEDASSLARLGLRLARSLTGAGAGLLAVADDRHPEDLLVVARDGDAATDETVAARLLAGDRAPQPGPGPVLSAEITAGAARFGVLRLGELPGPVGARSRAALDAVALALGSRVETLRQREVSDLHERITDAVWELDRTLADGVDLEVTLPLLVTRTRELARADAVALVAHPGTGPHRVLAADGERAAAALAELRPDLEEVLSTGTPHHWSARGTTPLPDGVHRRWTSLVPLETRGEQHVVLVVHSWSPPRGVPHHQVQDVISALALHAALILDRAHGEREHDLLTRLEDRDRIARDLHDLVIQRLFAVGLTLQGATRRAGSPEMVERLEGAVAELDQTIRDIRATIFELRHHPGQGSFRADLRALVDSYAPTLGFAPVLHVRGPLDSVPDEELHSQVLMVVRESLSNVTRHAHASSVQVTARIDANTLAITVQDDGVGVPADAVESGLSNVRARAADRGGRVRLDPAVPRGTRLVWSVPLA